MDESGQGMHRDLASGNRTFVTEVVGEEFGPQHPLQPGIVPPS